MPLKSSPKWTYFSASPLAATFCSPVPALTCTMQKSTFDSHFDRSIFSYRCLSKLLKIIPQGQFKAYQKLTSLQKAISKLFTIPYKILEGSEQSLTFGFHLLSPYSRHLSLLASFLLLKHARALSVVTPSFEMLSFLIFSWLVFVITQISAWTSPRTFLSTHSNVDPSCLCTIVLAYLTDFILKLTLKQNEFDLCGPT